MPTQMIWLTYDLGISGDYEGLYSWLDLRGAKECGDSVATLVYTYQGRLDDALVADLRNAVDMTNRARFYLVFHDETTGKEKGKFIIGRRRASTWTGYAPDRETADDEFLA